jgi:regulatory protein
MEADYKLILSRAMSLCSKSEKTVFDIRQSMSRWGMTDNEKQDKIIGYLLENDFIDEVRYSYAYVRDKHKFNRWGRVKIRAMLKAKGLADPVVENAVNSISQEEYIKTLKDDISGRRKRLKAKNQYDLRAKLMRFARSRGYETDLSYRIVDEVISS